MFPKNILFLKETFLKRLATVSQRFKLPEKWKGGRVEKLTLFWEGLYLDYKSVATDTIQECKNKPRKAILVSSGLAILLVALKTNPDEQSFYDRLVQNTADLTMIADPIRNPISEVHMTYLTRCDNQGLLRRTDLFFFTLIWIADYHRDCDIYPAHCKYLRPSFLTFYQRIIDIGLFGIWINMKLKMRDFDINPSEWVDSS